MLLLLATMRMQNLSSDMKKKRRREVYNTLQFAFAYVFYWGRCLYVDQVNSNHSSGVWASFNYQAYLTTEPPYLYSVQIYVSFLDAGATAFIQATTNSTVGLLSSPSMKFSMYCIQIRREITNMYREKFGVSKAAVVNVTPIKMNFTATNWVGKAE